MKKISFVVQATGWCLGSVVVPGRTGGQSACSWEWVRNCCCTAAWRGSWDSGRKDSLTVCAALVPVLAASLLVTTLGLKSGNAAAESVGAKTSWMGSRMGSWGYTIAPRTSPHPCTSSSTRQNSPPPAIFAVLATMWVPPFWLLNLEYLKVISTAKKFCTSQRSTLSWVSQAGCQQTEGLVENLGIASPAETTAIWPGSQGRHLSLRS